MFRRGRISLVIGLAFLAAAIAVSQLFNVFYPHSSLGTVVREGLLIVGWVAMWRPIEIRLLFPRLDVLP